MELRAFRVEMFKCIRDSGWVDVSSLTVFVGKNESGKTSLLTALHKFNPFSPAPYSMDREWPRGFRRDRTEDQVVCTCRFALSDEESAELRSIMDQGELASEVEVARDYAGRFEIVAPTDVFPDKLHPNDIDDACSSFPDVPEGATPGFRLLAQESAQEAVRLAKEGRYSELAELRAQQIERLNKAASKGGPHQVAEQGYANTYSAKLDEIRTSLEAAPSIYKKAHEYVVQHLPTFIFMSEYQSFQGNAELDQLRQRRDDKRLSPQDQTVLMILRLSGLDLDELVGMNTPEEREQRQYDLDDGARTLTNLVEARWQQRKYAVDFRADGQTFYTFVKDEQDPSLIRLEERSLGFQWFFSFDLLFMHESEGTFQDCVILLDDPGLHLHPSAQTDLLARLEDYAAGNTLLYSTHMPFMIDLREPERIRVLSETAEGTKAHQDLTESQPEGKLVLQAALGMSARQSFLVSQRNLVVEGADDYWILTELSNLLIRSGEEGLPEDVMVTAGGSASEAVYIATFMIGQELEVVALFDADDEGRRQKETLVKRWLTRYSPKHAEAVDLAELTGADRDMAIEDVFPEDWYLAKVRETYEELGRLEKGQKLNTHGKDPLVRRVGRVFDDLGLTFNKGSVAKRIRSALSRMKTVEDLPKGMEDDARRVIGGLRERFSTTDSTSSANE